MTGTPKEEADIVERLNDRVRQVENCDDFVSGEIMREAASEIATLRQQLAEANADCKRANEMINAAVDDYTDVRECLAAALDEWESHNGRLTDENDPHWTNDARRALAAGGEG